MSLAACPLSAAASSRTRWSRCSACWRSSAPSPRGRSQRSRRWGRGPWNAWTLTCPARSARARGRRSDHRRGHGGSGRPLAHRAGLARGPQACRCRPGTAGGRRPAARVAARCRRHDGRDDGRGRPAGLAGHRGKRGGMAEQRPPGPRRTVRLGAGPEPSPEDRGWLGAEAAAAALLARGEAWPEGQGPDEALCRLWEAAGGGPLDTGALLATVRAAGHPEAEAVAVAVAALAESGAALTAAQGVDLKVTLWRSSPSLWRTVRMPLAATLGDLHRAIQVLFGWDGDHLHAFTVAGVRYSDLFFDLEETATRRRSASVTPSRPAPASQSGTSTTSAPAGSTRSPARAHPALPRTKPSPAACPSAEITPSSTGTRTNPPTRRLSTWPRSTPRWRADPHAC